ncbi:MAG: hypothetical protein EAZ77_15330 [Nostocales cyanobacterium]|nr:MAG: hypothetical protein EAZ77_15330 [Nostocales cyanobacterium]
MTKPNTTGLSNQTSKKFNWPVWFPYPSSWLRTIILIAIAFPGTKLIIFGFTGVLVSISTKSLSSFLFVFAFGILIPTIILSFIYHIFWFFWQDKSLEKKWRKLIPNYKSLWEGFYATLVMGLSCLLILLMFAGLSFVYCQSYQETAINWARCSGSMTGRAANLIIGTIEDKNFTDKPWFVIWMIISVYLYQAEYLLKQRFLPKLKSKFQKNRIQEKTATVNPIDLEMDNLRGSMGLTQMKASKKSPPNAQSSNEVTKDDNFQKAVKLAKNAAQITRTAKTKTEWYQVGREWQKTIEMLKTVPASHPNYAVAQEKIIDYQKYINYAQKIVNGKHINN